MNIGTKITGKKITRKKYPIYIYLINFKAFIFVYPDIYPWILLDFFIQYVISLLYIMISTSF